MTTSQNTLKLAVVSAGLSVPSSTRLLADRLTQNVRRRLNEAGRDVEVTVVELRDVAADIANNLVTGFPPPRLADAIGAVTGADGLIAVTPVFSASYSGLFKSFFDVIDDGELAGLPVLAAATGGTARHSLVLEHAMRPLFAYLRAIVVPTSLYASAEDWGGTGDKLTDTLPARIARAGGELAELMRHRQGHAKPGSDSRMNRTVESDTIEGDTAAIVPFAEHLAALGLDNVAPVRRREIA